MTRPLSPVPGVNRTAEPYLLRPADGRRDTRHTPFHRGIGPPAPGTADAWGEVSAVCPKTYVTQTAAQRLAPYI